ARLGIGLPWVVHASDISRRMLDRCRLGIYEAERVKVPEPAWFARYFRRGFGEREGFYRVRPELRRNVRVSTINLFDDVDLMPHDQDVIFCRNAMIYFDDPSRQTLLDRLYEQVAPGGHLFVGHAESLLGLRHRFRQIGPAVYQRPAR
ncbi:MAG: protein-glutamate O-methyltransferase CheR, partial [Planctomycetes bacterium]|nr:protein-glutamate O-methyltransferase CheR [Planctomycetota bacterium]